MSENAWYFQTFPTADLEVENKIKKPQVFSFI
jgi:hypothetical protein